MITHRILQIVRSIQLTANCLWNCEQVVEHFYSCVLSKDFFNYVPMYVGEAAIKAVVAVG
jgi:hypothetical protein